MYLWVVVPTLVVHGHFDVKTSICHICMSLLECQYNSNQCTSSVTAHYISYYLSRLCMTACGCYNDWLSLCVTMYNMNIILYIHIHWKLKCESLKNLWWYISDHVFDMCAYNAAVNLW